MRERLSDFGDAEIVVIAFASPERVAAYQRERLAPLSVLIDTERGVYRSYGLRRGSVRSVWGPKIWWAYAKLIRRGRRLQLPAADTLQRRRVNCKRREGADNDAVGEVTDVEGFVAVAANVAPPRRLFEFPPESTPPGEAAID